MICAMEKKNCLFLVSLLFSYKIQTFLGPPHLFGQCLFFTTVLPRLVCLISLISQQQDHCYFVIKSVVTNQSLPKLCMVVLALVTLHALYY